MRPQWKVRIRYVILFCVLCVCVVAGVCLVAGCFFEKLKCMFAVFQKIKGASVDTLGLRSATKAQWWESKWSRNARGPENVFGNQLFKPKTHSSPRPPFKPKTHSSPKPIPSPPWKLASTHTSTNPFPHAKSIVGDIVEGNLASVHLEKCVSGFCLQRGVGMWV